MQNKRLYSLDILRGFDIFCLVILAPLLWSITRATDCETLKSFMSICFTHQAWEGILAWDMVMPLFLFMSGVTIPFALSKYLAQDSKKVVLYRIFKRFIVLWVLGMVCQGNLLDFNLDTLSFYSNTLQTIALGYLVSSILYIYTSKKFQIIYWASSLLFFWAAMEFISIGSYGAGDYSPQNNISELIDRNVLGAYRDGARTKDGVVVFATWYHYTWILSSINYILWVLSGLFAGYILKSDFNGIKKTLNLIYIGASLIAFGYIISVWHPIIKPIASSSFTLISSGYSFLLMALFHYIVDVKKWSLGINWLAIFGTNSILAYLISSVVSFSSITNSLLGGLEHITTEYYPIILTFGNLTITFVILYFLHKNKIFFKA